MIYLFADRLLDTDRRELWCGADLISVEPQVFDLVLHLIRHRERVVTKTELLAAVWKGRIVSESTISSRITAARRAIGDTGEDQQLIRTLARVGLRFVGEVQEEVAPGCGKPAHELSEWHASGFGQSDVSAPAAPFIMHKPSLEIHPFLDGSMGGDQDNFIRGIVDDVATALSQFPWLSVKMRKPPENSDDWTVDVRDPEQISALHYVLEGSVRAADDRIRVTTKLVDPLTGTLLWAKRFDAWHEDVLELHDQVTNDIVGALGPRLEQLEIARARQEPTALLDPSRCYLLGMGRLYEWSYHGMCEALALFQRATELDPEFASAYGMAAYCHVQMKSYGWVSDRERETAECARLAQQAAACAQEDAAALTKAAHAISSVVHDMDGGADFVDRALRINSNLATGWYVSGWIKLFMGEPNIAIEHLGQSLRLGQFDPLIFKMHAAAGYAHFVTGRYDEAAASAERALLARPDYLTGMRLAAAGHAMAGRLAQARGFMSRMHQLDPKLRVTDLPDLIPFQRRVDVERWVDALSKAGLPD